MDVLYFLKERTNFIRQLYDNSTYPFVEKIRKIEAGEEPYVPSYSEDPEPAFLEEWMEAHTSLDLLGMSCISMLSESLKLYFRTWEKELNLACRKQFKQEFKLGFINGYKAAFGNYLDVDWGECLVNFDILEQVTHARNSGQHPDEITTMNIMISGKTVDSFPVPFFIGDKEKEIIIQNKEDDFYWFCKHLKVTPRTLKTAIAQVEMLGEWLEEKMFNYKYP